MARYTFQQLKDLWTQAGGNPVYADMAAAVALAESGGDPNSTNVNQGGSAPGSVDRGLWQINSQYHPSQSTYDPMANARGAVSISNNGSNWRPWCTAWSNGRCGGMFLGPGSPVLKYLPGGQVVTGNVPTNGTQSAVLSDVILPDGTRIPAPGPNVNLQAISGFVGGIIGKVLGALGIPTPQEAGQTILKYIVWFAFILVGALLMLFGLILLVLGSRPAKALGRAVTGIGGTATQAAVTKRVWVGKKQSAQPVPEPQPVYGSPYGSPAQVSATPVTAPVLEPMPSTAPSYKPRHQLMVDPGAEGGAFRQGTGRKRPRARQAVAGRDKPNPTPDVFTVDTFLTPKYEGRRRK